MNWFFSFFRQRHLYLLLVLSNHIFSQNQNSKWYFGYSAGLDFMTNPPTVLFNGRTHTPEGGASIADASGNLLFYTSADTIWNKNHVVMANGTGLLGDQSSVQSALILKKPGSSSLYYVFTTDSGVSVNGLRYSVVDMTMAAGMGSVTVKNVLLHAPSSERLAATMHCNGQDIWIVSHGYNSNLFKSYLLSSVGLNSTAVNSSMGFIFAFNPGQMKISPGGKKLAMSFYKTNPVQLFDFDANTGQISNPLNLTAPFYYVNYGLEFSPDASKIYATGGSYSTTPKVLQWDLCNSSNQAILNSLQVVYTSQVINQPQLYGSMQLAPNGKIYIARGNDWPIQSQTNKILACIQNPNLLGSACNYIDTAIVLSPNFSFLSLPTFLLEQAPPSTPISFICNPLTCKTLSFTAPTMQANSSPSACSTLGYSLTNYVWNFDDPGSAAANTSSLTNPIHVYSTFGTYHPTLTVFYSCGGITQVLSQTINIQAPPNLSVTHQSICLNSSIQLSVIGANTYTWNTGASTASILVSPTVTTIYTVTGGNPPSLCETQETVSVAVLECLGTIEQSVATKKIKSYPNPVIDFLYIESHSSGSLKIMSVTGAVLFSLELEPGLIKIDFRMFDAGLYFVKMNSGEEHVFFKFIKTDN